MDWLHDLDRAVFEALYAGPTPGTAYSLMLTLTVLGTGWTLLAFVPFALVPRTRRVAIELILTLVAVGLVVQLAKMGVHRTRPYAALGVPAHGLSVARDWSFPSGHAAGSFGLASFLSARLRLPPALPPALFGLATAIALSRVYMGVHYPSDVAAGALIGAAIGASAGRWRRGRAPVAAG